MGRFKQKRVIIKVMPEVTLVFKDVSSIYAFPKNLKLTYVWHKWYAPLGTYGNNWRPFKSSLLNARRLSFERCCQLAYRYGVLGNSTVGKLDLRKKLVEIRHGSWSVKGTIDEL